jgi:low temperature requirement protein LtrA
MDGSAEQKSLLRPRDDHHGSRVMHIELFFDLVFVFAITEISHLLLADLSLAGAARTALLFAAVWWVWIYTTWATNWLNPERLPVRLLLFLLMLAGLAMATAIPRAFDTLGWAFAGAHVTAQVGRSLFMIVALKRHSHANAVNFQRILAWQVLASGFWLGGAASAADTRLLLWAIGMAIEFVSPALWFYVPGLGRSQASDWNVAGEHMAERCALFVIIALGETLILTGVTFEKAGWSWLSVAGMLASLTCTVAMWWLYFDTGAARGTQRIEESAAPGRMARLGYTYLHLPVVAGIVVAAVGDELVIAHPTGHTDLATALVVIGSPMLFLAGLLLFKRAVAGRTPLSHQLGLALLALAGIAWPFVAPLPLLILVSVVLIATAAWETASLRGPWAHKPME